VREIEVLRLISRGSTTREVAKELHVTERTVSAHLEKAYRKLRVRSRMAAVEAARRAGFL
jgi:DNA-binding NarL/FixJ family response regulator